MRRYLLALGTMGLAPLVIAAALDCQSSEANLSDPVSRGRYLVRIAGCNDCGTPAATSVGLRCRGSTCAT